MYEYPFANLCTIVNSIMLQYVLGAILVTLVITSTVLWSTQVERWSDSALPGVQSLAKDSEYVLRYKTPHSSGPTGVAWMEFASLESAHSRIDDGGDTFVDTKNVSGKVAIDANGTRVVLFSSSDSAISGDVSLRPRGGSSPGLMFYNADGSKYTSFTSRDAPTQTTITYLLPTDDGTSGQLLTTDGTGALSWSSVDQARIQDLAGTTYVSTTDTEGHITLKANGVSIVDVAQSYVELTQDLLLQTGLLLQDNGAANAVTLTAPAVLGASYTLTMPTTNGASGQYLTNNGAGALYWSAPQRKYFAVYTTSASAAPRLGSEINLAGTGFTMEDPYSWYNSEFNRIDIFTTGVYRIGYSFRNIGTALCDFECLVGGLNNLCPVAVAASGATTSTSAVKTYTAGQAIQFISLTPPDCSFSHVYIHLELIS